MKFKILWYIVFDGSKVLTRLMTFTLYITSKRKRYVMNTYAIISFEDYFGNEFILQNIQNLDRKS